jgi:hypothetical protein
MLPEDVAAEVARIMTGRPVPEVPDTPEVRAMAVETLRRALAQEY